MIVVALIGILSAIAVPSFLKYIKRAKTAEARQQLEKISAGARIYYSEEQRDPSSFSPIPAQFPGTIGLTPGVPCCDQPGKKCAADVTEWAQSSWKALKFAMDDPHFFMYEFQSSGVDNAAEFTAMAHADLDCDGEMSTFISRGEIQFNGADVTASGALVRIKELE